MQIPPDPPKAIREAANTLAERRATLTAAQRERFGLENSRHEAVERDRVAAADALERGEDVPPAKHVPEHDAAVAEATRRESAHELAVQRAQARVREAVSEHRDQWRRDNAKQIGKAKERAVRALAEAERAIQEVAACKATDAWLAHEDLTGRWMPERALAPSGLLGRNGETVSREELWRALHATLDGAMTPAPQVRDVTEEDVRQGALTGPQLRVAG